MNDRVVVDPDYYWRDMATCPRAMKVQLLNPGGVAIHGQYHGEPFWGGWTPLPKKRPKEEHEPEALDLQPAD